MTHFEGNDFAKNFPSSDFKHFVTAGDFGLSLKTDLDSSFRLPAVKKKSPD